MSTSLRITTFFQIISQRMPGKDFLIAEGKLRIPIGIGFLEFQRCLDGQIKINGLMLVLELHGEHATGTIMNEIVTAVNSNLVKINYDTANCVFYGNVDAADDIDTCMDNVAYLHIKDKAGARDAWDFPALGKGYVDFKTLFNKLDKANNDAPLSLEIEFTAKGPKDLDEINTAVKESAAYLENLGYKI